MDGDNLKPPKVYYVRELKVHNGNVAGFEVLVVWPTKWNQTTQGFSREKGIEAERAAICQAVIASAWAAGECHSSTKVGHIRRKSGKARVTVKVNCGGSAGVVKRTGISDNSDTRIAAAEACVRAIAMLPPVPTSAQSFKLSF